METFRKRSTWINPLALYRRVKKTKCVVLKDPYMVSNNLPDYSTLDSMKPSLQLAFLMVSEDHCVYVKRITKGIMFLTLYVDDILLARNNLEMINATKQWLSSVFKVKYMGEARYVLGVKIVRNRPKKLLGMCQEAYIKRVLECFRMHYSKSVDTPVEKGLT